MIQVYQSFPYGSLILEEYGHLCKRVEEGSSDYAVPYIGEIVQEVWQSASNHAGEQNIKEAILRRDYEIYGMNPNDFAVSALRKELPEFQSDIIPAEEILRAALNYLSAHYICFMDYDGMLVNSPVGSGVW